MKDTSISIRLSKEDKEVLDKICSYKGIPQATLFTIFIKWIVNNGKIPREIFDDYQVDSKPGFPFAINHQGRCFTFTAYHEGPKIGIYKCKNEYLLATKKGDVIGGRVIKYYPDFTFGRLVNEEPIWQMHRWFVILHDEGLMDCAGTFYEQQPIIWY